MISVLQKRLQRRRPVPGPIVEIMGRPDNPGDDDQHEIIASPT
jgi:hypothetical protein